MQEYWINVYGDYSTTIDENKFHAIQRTTLHKNFYKSKTLYRIHVKMKAPKGSDMEKRMYNGADEFVKIFEEAKKEFDEVVRDTAKGFLDNYRGC